MKITALIQSAALAALVMLPANVQAGVPCRVAEVAAFSNRVHVKCSGFSPISFYAVPTSNSGEAARFTTMASMALGSVLYIETESGLGLSATGPSFGCLLQNCVRALSWTLKE